MNITLKRNPLWKRRLLYPKVFIGHFNISRRRNRSILQALSTAFYLSKLTWRK